MERQFDEFLTAMKTVTSLYDYTPVPCAATIGSFDGVHRGHCAMLAELRSKAAAAGLPVMAITFAKHPRMLFNAGCEPFLLCSREEKEAMLASQGVDILVLLDFNEAMASMSALDFMKSVLLSSLGVKMLAVGYDHRFGKPCATEGVEDYILYGKQLGIDVFSTSPFTIDGGKVSSSAVRRLLAAGDVAAATKLLGRNYRFSGRVVHCAGIGRTIGFPTANIELGENMQLLPSNGVYEVVIEVSTVKYKGVMNIGVKPTVSNTGVRTVEVYIIDFSGDIYGHTVSVEVVRRLRDERTFSNLNALRLQIETDVVRVKKGI